MSQSDNQHNLVQYEGYLYKKGVYNKSWKRRYFVLYKDRTVDYFKDKSHASQRNKAKGTIQLTQIQRVEVVQCTDTNNTKNKSNATDPIRFLNNQSVFSIINEHISFNGVVSSHQTLPGYDTNSRKQSAASIPSISISSLELQESKESIPDISICVPQLSNHSKRRWSSFSNDSICHVEPNDSENFQTVLNDSKSRLKCDRPYSFALISSSRNWILSVDNTKDLKTWISKFSQWSQGEQICDGHFNKDKYYVLYKNKVLHGYNKNMDKSCIEVDIDLNNMLYMKYMIDKNTIEIGLPKPQYQQNITLCLKNETKAKMWYNKIISMFHKQSIIKHEYCSMIKNLNVVHEDVLLCYRHVGIYAGFMVIFNNKSQCHSIKHNTLFFNKKAFKEYMEEDFTVIELNDTVRFRRASRSHGGYAFCVSDNSNKKKWYFSVKTRSILNEWMDCLSSKDDNYNQNRRISLPSFSNMDFEPTKLTVSYSAPTNAECVDENIQNLKQIRVNQKTNVNLITLAPIIDKSDGN